MNQTATKQNDKSMEIMAPTVNLKVCDKCRVKLGAPIRADDEKQVFKCPKCKGEITQYFGF